MSKVNLEKKSGFSLKYFRLLYYPGIRQSFTTLLYNFRSIICEVVVYGRLKTKEKFEPLALKVVAVAYERW